jgi:hypothetical protein
LGPEHKLLRPLGWVSVFKIQEEALDATLPWLRLYRQDLLHYNIPLRRAIFGFKQVVAQAYKDIRPCTDVPRTRRREHFLILQWLDGSDYFAPYADFAGQAVLQEWLNIDSEVREEQSAMVLRRWNGLKPWTHAIGDVEGHT